MIDQLLSYWADKRARERIQELEELVSNIEREKDALSLEREKDALSHLYLISFHLGLGTSSDVPIINRVKNIIKAIDELKKRAAKP